MKDLVERAAKHVAALNGHSDDWERFLEEAYDYVRFIRAEALEEAARVAWLHGDAVSVSKYDTASSAIAANRMAVNICATIRALKEKQG